MVGHPSPYIARVLGQQGQFSCVQVQAIRIEYLRVALVHADDDQRIYFFQRVDNIGSDVRKVGVRFQVRTVDVHAI